MQQLGRQQKHSTARCLCMAVVLRMLTHILLLFACLYVRAAMVLLCRAGAVASTLHFRQVSSNRRVGSSSWQDRQPHPVTAFLAAFM